MRTILLAGALLAFTAPAHSQAAPQSRWSWGPCPIAGSCTITQDWLVGYQSNPEAAKFPPIPVSDGDAHVVGERKDPNDPLSDYTVYSSAPDTRVDVPVTITDQNGDSKTFDVAVAIAGMALMVAANYEVPLAGAAGSILGIASFVNTVYGPVTDAAYAHVKDMVQSTIDAGVGQMNSGGLPIGPDPVFNYSFAIEATTFNGSFDAYGDINSINNIHDVSLFVDGVSANPLAAIPETSTWVMTLIGFVAVVLVGGRRRLWAA
jgi:hypothetical protein